MGVNAQRAELVRYKCIVISSHQTKIIILSNHRSCVNFSILQFNLLEHESDFFLCYLLQIFLSQSVSQDLRALVSRGLLEMWLLATWVLRVSYTCNLMAFLTVPVLQAPLTTLEQLADADLR